MKRAHNFPLMSRTRSDIIRNIPIASTVPQLFYIPFDILKHLESCFTVTFSKFYWQTLPCARRLHFGAFGFFSKLPSLLLRNLWTILRFCILCWSMSWWLLRPSSPSSFSKSTGISSPPVAFSLFMLLKVLPTSTFRDLSLPLRLLALAISPQ